MAATKRQIAKLSKRQIGFQIGQNVLSQISNLANGVRLLLEKGRGVDQRTGQESPLNCAPADIKRSLTPEQLSAVEEFIGTWALDAEPEPKVPKAAAAPPAQKKKKK